MCNLVHCVFDEAMESFFFLLIYVFYCFQGVTVDGTSVQIDSNFTNQFIYQQSQAQQQKQSQQPSPLGSPNVIPNSQNMNTVSNFFFTGFICSRRSVSVLENVCVKYIGVISGMIVMLS